MDVCVGTMDLRDDLLDSSRVCVCVEVVCVCVCVSNREQRVSTRTRTHRTVAGAERVVVCGGRQKQTNARSRFT